MTELRDYIFAIEVPDSAYDISIKGRYIEGFKRTGAIYWYRELPPGPYEILFTTKDVIEQQAASIVEREGGGFAGNVEGYKEYFKPGDWSVDHEPFKSAIKSLQSLLISKGLTAGNYLIIKKVEG